MDAVGMSRFEVDNAVHVVDGAALDVDDFEMLPTQRKRTLKILRRQLGP